MSLKLIFAAAALPAVLVGGLSSDFIDNEISNLANKISPSAETQCEPETEKSRPALSLKKPDIDCKL